MVGLRTDLPILETIGAYRLLKHLGADGSVQVYLARGEGPGRPSGDVVLEIVSGLVDEDVQRIEELRGEATAFCNLRHAGIIRTYEFFEHENSLVLVVEHVDGLSLAELAAAGTPNARPFSDDAVLHATISICDALAYAHAMCDSEGRSSPVVHKAVSPSKARVARDGTVKLGGFGLSKPFGVSVDRTGGRLRWESTYLAPEQILGQPLSPKVDVYAAGLILWELLTGRSSAIVLPKDLFSVPNEMRAMAERSFESLGKLRPDLPRTLSAAVEAALVALPEKRTIGCAELAQELRKHARVARGREDLFAKLQATRAPSAATSRRPTQPPAPSGAAPRVGPISARPVVAIGAPARVPPPPPQFIPSSEPARRPPPLPPAPSAIDSTSSAAMAVPAVKTPPETLVPSLSAELETADVVPAIVSRKPSAAARVLALALDRLRAASRMPRNAKIAISVGVPLALASLIALAFVGRSHGPAQPKEIASTNSLAEILPAAPLPPNTAPSLPTASPVQAPAVQAPAAPVQAPKEPSAKAIATARPQPVPAVPTKGAKAPLPASTDGEFSMSLKKKHLGHLTVHSSAPYAKVYMMLNKLGRVEEKMTVVCGQRFISIGLPPRPGRAEPTWLAPGQSVHIPCGGSLTVTMNPRRVR
jgi:serine/threonine-protein kinase